MLTLLYNFNLIVGHLVPNKKHNEYWQLYMMIRQITLISFNHFLTKTTQTSLKNLVESHNSLFVKLFGGNLRYKQHMLLHYPLIMEKSGPLNDLSNMRWENYNGLIIKTIKATPCKKNLLKTSAIKMQMRLDNFLLNFDFNDINECGKI